MLGLLFDFQWSSRVAVRNSQRTPTKSLTALVSPTVRRPWRPSPRYLVFTALDSISFRPSTPLYSATTALSSCLQVSSDLHIESCCQCHWQNCYYCGWFVPFRWDLLCLNLVHWRRDDKSHAKKRKTCTLISDLKFSFFRGRNLVFCCFVFSPRNNEN